MSIRTVAWRVRGCAGALVLLMAALVIGLRSAGEAHSQSAALKTYSKKSSYDDVRADLQNTIVGRGLVIDFNGQVSKMLDRTASDLGAKGALYKQAEYFAFCSAKLSRQTMEADRANLGFCPYVVFIYETMADPGRVHVGYRRLPSVGSIQSRVALKAVEALLDGIAKEAVK